MNIVRRKTEVFAALSLAALFVSSPAGAWPNCGAAFRDTYQNATYQNSQTEFNAGCQTCHQSSGGGNLNVYGDDLLRGGARGVGPACTATIFVAALRAVEALDSDQEGNDNLAEIVASAQPGWCAVSPGDACTNSAGTPPDVLLDPFAVNAVPTADVGGPYAGEAGTTLIQFDGSRSSDPDVGDTLIFAWDFGDGSTASGMMPTYTYPSAGNFEVSLIVSDGSASSEPSVTSATISAPPMNIAPIANPGGPYEGVPGTEIAFNGEASSDPNGDVLTFTWDFGDGAIGSGAASTHAFSAVGTYTVSLTVDDGQSSHSASTTATIASAPANRAPTADAGGPYSGTAGSGIRFNGAASSDPDDDILTYLWDFGDGTTGDGPTPTHVYRAPGTFDVRLSVSDGEFAAEAVTDAVVTDTLLDANRDGAALYETNCLACHGDPWSGPAVDGTLPGIRRVAGARSCSVHGSIFGTSVFPSGVPDMQFLQGLGETDIDAISEYLNSRDASGEQRYVTACAGCHGNTGSGGKVGEDVHGDSAGETFEAIAEESEMRYLACMPETDIVLIADFLMGFDDDNDNDGISDDRDDDDDNDGIIDRDDDDDDNDGLGDDDEREYGTDPRDSDTDDDGVSDGDEHAQGTDPLDSDTDNDGLDDGDEHRRGTDPNDIDSDDDGVSDGDEVTIFGSNPLLADNAAAGGDPAGGGGSGDLPLLALLVIASLIGRRQRMIALLRSTF